MGGHRRPYFSLLKLHYTPLRTALFARRIAIPCEKAAHFCLGSAPASFMFWRCCCCLDKAASSPSPRQHKAAAREQKAPLEEGSSVFQNFGTRLSAPLGQSDYTAFSQGPGAQRWGRFVSSFDIRASTAECLCSPTNFWRPGRAPLKVFFFEPGSTNVNDLVSGSQT